MSDRGVCSSVETGGVTGPESKSTPMSVHLKGHLEGLRVKGSYSKKKGSSRRQSQRAVLEGNTWYKMQGSRMRECNNVSNDGDFSHESVIPSDASTSNNYQSSNLRNVESHKHFKDTETASIRGFVNTDLQNATKTTSCSEKVPKNKEGMVIDKSAKRFDSNLRLFPNLRPQACTESKSPDGFLDKFVRYCHIKQAHNQHSHRRGHVVDPEPNTKRSRLYKQPRATLFAPDGDCKAACSDVSTATSTLSMQRSHDTKNVSTTCRGKSENEDQFMMQISAQVQDMQLSPERTSALQRDTIAGKPNSALPVASLELGVQHSEQWGNLQSLSPIDEVNTLTSVTDMPTTRRPTGCEDDARTEVTLADSAKQETNPGFGSQNFMHFTTTIGSPPRKMIRIAPGVIQRNMTPQLVPYGQVPRCMPIKSQLRMGRLRKHHQAAPDITVVMAGKNTLFLRKQFIKKSFFLPESANLEEILADSDDRRIIAICNKFHCEMVAFSKVPRKGSLKHEVILSAGCRDDIARCARCLDARLNWCISPQLD